MNAREAGLRAMLRLLFGSWLVVAATACSAARLALLVGVSQYPGLPAGLQLIAPANDVRLMRQVLIQRGFEERDIEVLADGVDGARLPTLAAIVAALESIAKRAHAGDIVYLHFSGHGSLQPVYTGSADPRPGEPSWQPIFLPRDVRSWDGKSGSAVPNALPDTRLRMLVDAIGDTGAFVFAVFDACHSAKLVRGARDVDLSLERSRQVSPRAFGVMEPEPAVPVLPDWMIRSATTSTRAVDEHRGHRGQAVYFYASQSFELAASLPLPHGDREAWHGLFSWHVAQALALGQPMSYRQLAQHLLARYDQLPAATATPLFSGDGLDQIVFGERFQSVRQWPLEQRQGRLVMPAGALSGIAEGALLAVLPDPASPSSENPRPPQGTLGFVRVTSVEVNRSRLDPVGWQGWAAPTAALLPSAGDWVRLMSNPSSFALHVFVDRSECHAACPAERALAKTLHDGVPGVDLRPVSFEDAADVRLRATDLGVRLQLPGAEAAPTALDQNVQAGSESDEVLVLIERLAKALHRVARTRNLLQLAARLSTNASATGLRLTLKLRKRDSTVDTPISAEQLVMAVPGDVLLLDGRNEGGDPVDVAVFWLGADQSVHQVYPEDARDSPRMSAGESLKPIGMAIDPASNGVERLLVLTMPMQRGQEVTDFRFLEQDSIARGGVVGNVDLQALMDACFAEYRVRGASSPAPSAEKIGLQLFTFRISPS